MTLSHLLTKVSRATRPARIFPCVVLLTAFGPFVASSQDMTGSRDHRLVPRVEGYEIQLYDASEVGAHGFSRDGHSYEVEGKFTRIFYALSDGATPVAGAAIARRCADALVKRGGTKIYDAVTDAGHVLTVSVPMSGVMVWVEVLAQPDGGAYTVTVVEEGQAETPEEPQTGAEISPLALIRLLEEKGIATLSSVMFDGKTATLSADSELTLLSVVQALQLEPSLKLEVRGHTFDAETAIANMRLSKERAAAIRKYLIDKGGIDGSRIVAVGLGDRRPVAQDQSGGSGPNSRIELVQK